MRRALLWCHGMSISFSAFCGTTRIGYMCSNLRRWLPVKIRLAGWGVDQGREFMGRARRKPGTPPTAPLKRVPRRPSGAGLTALVAELRKLHVAADDPRVELMPADEDPRGVLLYAEKQFHALKDPASRRHAAKLRVKGWEILRWEADPHQSQAVLDARDAGASWGDLAADLGFRDGAVSAAQSKARRLRASQLEELPGVDNLRRTPEAVTQAEALLAAEDWERYRSELMATRRGDVTVGMARKLLAVETQLEMVDDADYWLEQVAAVVEDCHTPRQVASLEKYLSAALRRLRRVEQPNASARSVLDELSEWGKRED